LHWFHLTDVFLYQNLDQTYQEFDTKKHLRGKTSAKTKVLISSV